MVNEKDSFSGFPESRPLYDALMELVYTIGSADIRVNRSQITLVRARPFARIWIPEKHLLCKAASLVLSLSFPQQDTYPHWKQIVEPAPGRHIHHLEIYTTNDLDQEVQAWLQEAWKYSG
jgi:hypothetical protein